MEWKVVEKGSSKEKKPSSKSRFLNGKSKKVLLLTGLFAPVIAAGFLNYSLTSGAWSAEDKSVSAETNTDKAVSKEGVDVFETFREERAVTREQELEYIESVMASTETDEATKADAQAQKLALAGNMEKELMSEGLIKTSMGLETVVSVGSSLVSVVVGAEELSDEQVGKIANIVSDETGQTPQNIKIIPQATKPAG